LNLDFENNYHITSHLLLSLARLVYFWRILATHKMNSAQIVDDESNERPRGSSRKVASSEGGKDHRDLSSQPIEEGTSLKRQRWTELTAVGQILSDEIVQHLETKKGKLSHNEEEQLRTWKENVQNRIYHQTSLVLENVNLATELRDMRRKVELTRDDIMILRTQIKLFRDEAMRLDETFEKVEEESQVFHDASRFLSALQTLAQNSPSDM
jgi:hypothetical protein